MVEYVVTTIIDGGNWGSGNFSSVAKPIIREVIDDEEIELDRYFRFKRVIITLQITELDPLEKGFDRNKEDVQSFEAYQIWIKDGDRSKMRDIYNKLRDIIIIDNDQTVFSWITVGELQYVKERGKQIGKLEVLGHKTSKSRI